MIINRITLKNFGIYYGECTIDMQIQKSKNIVLLGGKNGSGKTTLLNALRTVLYGSQIYGAKSATQKYLDYIKEKFNLKAFNEGQNNWFIEIDFDLHEDGIYNNYLIKRSWDLIGETQEKVIETLAIEKNSESLDQSSIEDLENYFRTFMPKEIFDFFFFDGEKIKELIENEDLNEILKKEILTLFNLDIFDILREDIGRYSKWKEKKNKASAEEIRIGEIKDRIEELENALISLEKETSEKESDFTSSTLRLAELEKDFYNKGGLTAEEIAELKAKEASILEEEGSQQLALSEFAKETLPFLVLQEDILKLEKRLEKEKNKEAYDLLNERVDKDSLISHLSSKELDQNIVEKFLSKIDDFYKMSLEIDENISQIHTLSKNDASKISGVAEELKGHNYGFVEDLFANINKVKTEVKAIKDRISHNERDPQLEEIKEDMEALKKEAEYLERASLELKEKQANTLLEMESMEKELNELLLETKKFNNKVVLNEKISNVLSNFIDVKKKQKMDDLEVYFMEMFNCLHRKKNFIKKVSIENSTLNIKLYDNENNNIAKKMLSEGEKQIYVLSLLYALIKTSGRKIPLVMDTLLGRLDTEHRENILKHYLPKVSDQIIILSTDSEINEGAHQLIKDSISREYEMQFDVEKRELNIQNSYFFSN